MKNENEIITVTQEHTINKIKKMIADEINTTKDLLNDKNISDINLIKYEAKLETLKDIINRIK